MTPRASPVSEMPAAYEQDTLECQKIAAAVFGPVTPKISTGQSNLWTSIYKYRTSVHNALVSAAAGYVRTGRACPPVSIIAHSPQKVYIYFPFGGFLEKCAF